MPLTAVDYPWVISIMPMAGTTGGSDLVVVAGTWAALLDTGSLHNGIVYNTTGAQNDEAGWDLTLAAGTYKFSYVHWKANDEGIATVLLDGVSVGTVDAYNSSQVKNVYSEITGITVATSGKHRLTLKAATKNASSSNFIVSMQAVQLRRTA